MLSLGIDVAGAPGQSLTLALIRWGASLQTPAVVAWEAVPLGKLGSDYPPFRWPQIVSAAGQGTLALVAKCSFQIAEYVCLCLQAVFGRLGVQGKSQHEKALSADRCLL
jgi:hypothetical protein